MDSVELFSNLEAGGDAQELGAVLVWRAGDGAVQHAAVSLGHGYVFHKEEQTWWSPWQVVTYDNVIERWSDAGLISSY